MLTEKRFDLRIMKNDEKRSTTPLTNTTSAHCPHAPLRRNTHPIYPHNLLPDQLAVPAHSVLARLGVTITTPSPRLQAGWQQVRISETECDVVMAQG